MKLIVEPAHTVTGGIRHGVVDRRVVSQGHQVFVATHKNDRHQSHTQLICSYGSGCSTPRSDLCPCCAVDFIRLSGGKDRGAVTHSTSNRSDGISLLLRSEPDCVPTVSHSLTHIRLHVLHLALPSVWCGPNCAFFANSS